MISMKEIQGVVKRMLEPIRVRIMMIVGRAVIEAVTDGKGIQLVKGSLLKGENRDGMERFQEYGFTGTPPPGCEAVVVFPGGNREHGIVVGMELRALRPKDIPEGGAAIYSTNGEELKTIVKVLPNGNIEIGKDTLEKIVAGETFKTFFNSHKHIGNMGVATGGVITAMTDAQLSSKVKAAK